MSGQPVTIFETHQLYKEKTHKVIPPCRYH